MHPHRWRVILLSPEEEDNIAAQLAGPGWYRAVGEILSTDAAGPPAILPPSDWRLAWVRDTLRRLERAIPTLQREDELCPHWADCGPDDIPLPPPADYPLRPRPRGAEQLRRWAELSCARVAPPAPHEDCTMHRGPCSVTICHFWWVQRSSWDLGQRGTLPLRPQ